MTHTLSVQTPRLAPATRQAVPHRPGPVVAPVHDDREDAPTWMRALGAALLLGGLGLTAAVLGWPGDAPETALLVPAFVGVAVGFLLLVAQTGCSVTTTHVVLHFRPLPARRIPLARITDVRLVEADASTYGGIGLRYDHGVRALILTPGAGIEFTDDRGRVTFVRTQQPGAALRALRALR